MENYLMNVEMDARATAVMTGEGATDDSVTQVVMSFATMLEITDNDILIMTFRNSDDCSTAMQCMNDAKALTQRLNDRTMAVCS